MLCFSAVLSYCRTNRATFFFTECTWCKLCEENVALFVLFLYHIPVKLLPSKSIYLLRFSAVLSYCHTHLMYTVKKNAVPLFCFCLSPSGEGSATRVLLHSSGSSAFSDIIIIVYLPKVNSNKHCKKPVWLDSEATLSCSAKTKPDNVNTALKTTGNTSKC